MDFLENKVVFITGASSGIGRATALMLLEKGAKVFDFSIGQTLSEEKPHGNLRSFKGDVTSESSVIAGFTNCLESFGTVDVLLNNAGLGLVTSDLSVTELDAFDLMMNVNVKGVFLCNREALKIMKPKGGGHILTLISMAGQRTNPTAPIYCASKFGARGLSSGLADQALKAGIKVTDINPGPVDSNYWGDRQVAREKFLKVEDVARVIVFTIDQPDYMVVREINFDNMKFLA
jgi:NADP-dependent 3-hydroxy acid dehydrogenase YdfG